MTHNICIIRAHVLKDFAEEDLDEPAMAVHRIVENNAEDALKRNAIACTLPVG